MLDSHNRSYSWLEEVIPDTVPSVALEITPQLERRIPVGLPCPSPLQHAWPRRLNIRMTFDSSRCNQQWEGDKQLGKVATSFTGPFRGSPSEARRAFKADPDYSVCLWNSGPLG